MTPLQLLYKGWVQESHGEINLEQWVMENSERVQNLREKRWDGNAKERTFKTGNLVLMRILQN